MWTVLLEETGVAVTPVDASHVLLTRDGDTVRFAVVSAAGRIHPSQISAPPEPNSLLLSTALSPAAAKSARALGWSAAPDEGPAWLLWGDTVIDLVREPAAEAPPKRRPGRPGWGQFSVARALLALEDGATQTELAGYAQVSQPRISQMLQDLAQRELIIRIYGGWAVRDRLTLIQWWLANYPGPGGLSSHWFGVAPVVEQAYRVHELLVAHDARPAVSGDVAADAVAPWRAPQRALLYAAKGADLTQTELTPASPADATLTLVLPTDPAVWPIAKEIWTIGLTGYGNVARAGALQVLYDLTTAAGPDATDAAERWLDFMMQPGPVL